MGVTTSCASGPIEADMLQIVEPHCFAATSCAAKSPLALCACAHVVEGCGLSVFSKVSLKYGTAAHPGLQGVASWLPISHAASAE